MLGNSPIHFSKFLTCFDTMSSEWASCDIKVPAVGGFNNLWVVRAEFLLS
jgi:hypothetical protein